MHLFQNTESRRPSNPCVQMVAEILILWMPDTLNSGPGHDIEINYNWDSYNYLNYL